MCSRLALLASPIGSSWSPKTGQTRWRSALSLKYAILGILIEKPMHGYELKQAVSPALSRERLMNDGVLYPLLAKMEREGLGRKKV